MRVLVACLGNPFRRDDGLGPEVARRLRTLSPRGVDVAEPGDDLLELLDAWQGYDRVIIVDALRGSAPPGRLVVLRPEDLRGEGPSVSVHALDVRTVLGVATALERRPPQVTVMGLVGADFSHGWGLSPAVKEGLSRLVNRILEEVACTSST